MKHTLPKTQNRNLGIDQLRIISMLMVLTLHILGAGKILEACEPFSFRYICAWTLEVICYCAVNCYGLISGYIGIHSKYRYANIITLWLQVLFYSFFLTALFFFIPNSDVGGLALIFSLFPVYTEYLWYFTAYFGLFLLLPLVNRTIISLNHRQAAAICIIIVVFFSLIPTLLPAMGNDVFSLNGGYSILWLLLLYILGACIKHFEFFKNIKNYVLIICYLFCVTFSLGSKILIESGIISVIENFIGSASFINYTSPTILLCGLSLLLWGTKLNIRNKAVITTITVFAPVSFGVYALHMHKNVQIIIFKNSLLPVFLNLHPLLMILCIIIYAVLLFLIFALIDHIRLLIFKKSKIKERLYKLEQKYIGTLWDSD